MSSRSADAVIRGSTWRSGALTLRPVQRPKRGVINVAHVITGLGMGGAENMLLKLLAHTDRRAFAAQVFTLGAASGPIVDQIGELGFPVVSLGMEREAPSPRRVMELGRLLRQNPPDLVQTWMYHADLVGGLAAKIGRVRLPVVWNLRLSNPHRAFVRRRTLWLIRLCAALSSRLPHTIICCSAEAQRVHSALGYQASKMRTIPNGFDVGRFRPNPEARAAMRAELGIPESAWIIGMVARFHPQKDHRSFIEAAAQLGQWRSDVHFVLCGPRITTETRELVGWIDSAGLRPTFHLLGPRPDVERVAAAFDVASLSSVDEGFPNVVGEAMACGVPCVATDVGETARLVGDTGRIVPPGNPSILAQTWRELLEMGRPGLVALGARARRRVEEHFSIGDAVHAYEGVYSEVVGR